MTSQQVLGLTLVWRRHPAVWSIADQLKFYTYAAYFFESAGIADPFAVTCITNGVQLVVILIVAAIVDRFGRRNLACGGLTTMLVAVTCIGILGSAPDSSASDSLLVFFACVFSKSAAYCSTGWLILHSRRTPMLRFDGLGVCRGDLVAAPSSIHSRFRRGHIMCWRSHHERPGAVHAQ